MQRNSLVDFSPGEPQRRGEWDGGREQEKDKGRAGEKGRGTLPRQKSAGEIPCKYLEIRSGNTQFSKIDSTLAQGTARARTERILDLQQLRIRERTGTGALTHCEQVQLLKIKDVSAVASHAPFPRASCWRFLKIAGSPQKFAEGLPGGFFAGGT